jgi:hypothetical protein
MYFSVGMSEPDLLVDMLEVERAYGTLQNTIFSVSNT